jgi:hypothetical protein
LLRPVAFDSRVLHQAGLRLFTHESGHAKLLGRERDELMGNERGDAVADGLGTRDDAVGQGDSASIPEASTTRPLI